jgi:FtsH-binding integral membrane protein
MRYASGSRCRIGCRARTARLLGTRDRDSSASNSGWRHVDSNRTTVRDKSDRLFFTGMALASALMLFLGFLPSYFHRGAELPPLTALYQLHGAVFTAWIALLVVQTALVTGGRTDIHRTLGVAGAVLAAVVLVVGVAVSVETLRRNGGPGDPRKFFAIPLGDIIVFGALVGAALVQRRRPETHKRLMLLATISLLTAAVGRFLRQVGMGGAPNLFFGTDVFVLALVLYDLASRGRVHPATLWGGAMVVAFKPLLFYAVAATPPWLALADALRG